MAFFFLLCSHQRESLFIRGRFRNSANLSSTMPPLCALEFLIQWEAYRGTCFQRPLWESVRKERRGTEWGNLLTRTKQAPEGPVTSNYWDENKVARQHVLTWFYSTRYQSNDRKAIILGIPFKPSPLCSCLKCPPLSQHGFLCTVDPHDVSTLALSAHTSPHPPIIWLLHKQSHHKGAVTAAVLQTSVLLSLSSAYFFFFFWGGWGGGFSSCFAPMHIPPYSVPSRPHLCLLQPLFPPTLHIPRLSGWKVQWGCRIPEGQRGLCLIPSRAPYVCKSQLTDRPVGSLRG